MIGLLFSDELVNWLKLVEWNGSDYWLFGMSWIFWNGLSVCLVVCCFVRSLVVTYKYRMALLRFLEGPLSVIGKIVPSPLLQLFL